MTDLRLAPAALTVWAAAAIAVGARPAPVLVASAVCAVLLAALLCLDRRRAVRRSRSGGTTAGARPGAVGGAALLLVGCLTAVLVSAGAQLASRSTAGLDGLARTGATATVTATVRSGVVPRTNPWSGAADQHEVRVELRGLEARGVRTTTRGPLTVVGAGQGWADVRYGGLVTATGRLGVQGDRTVLRVDAAPRTVRAPPVLLRAVESMRSDLLAATDPLDAQARGLVPGVAIGDTTRLDDDLDDAMRTTSLTHVTAVSGGHFAIVVACVAGTCVALRAPRWARVGITALATAGFVLLVHPEPSVVRAAAMGAVGLAGLALGRPSRAITALSAAVVVLVVADPWLARSYGFVLSVAATAGLALGAAPLARALAAWCGRVLAHAIALPVAAQAACAPVLVLLDPSVSAYAVPANLLAAPALAPATLLGVLATLVAPSAPGTATVVAWLAGRCTWWIATVARFFADLPGARLPWPGGWGGLVLLAALTATAVGLCAWLRRRSGAPQVDMSTGRRPRPVVLLAAALVLGLVLGGLHAARTVRDRGGVPGDWVVVACDVGQGDALVLRSGPGSAVVVDVGPAGDAASRCLDLLGVRRVDLLVLSHFHADHVGGLEPVLAGRTVQRALVTGARDPVHQADQTLAALDAARVPVEVPEPGESGTVGPGSVRWQVLQVGAQGQEANDASIALRVEVEGVDVVALGDLEDAGQGALAATLDAPGGVAAVDVVKVAHHGSSVQSDRLARLLSPSVALVSSGENTYGHPTDRALDLYRSGGATVLRTDLCGPVVLVVRGDELGVAGCP
ncbi:ComEC/Rec2 family competence protein [Cellulosimicrobium arenosum]|uniref:ComEC/Rec2 family competence protein n=1 Tax=Cellulosimicrobium arenosum TaxID=2708133 RepID=A0A927J2P6_9MICO|nr:ComEC/Rec2 family competence protein [Cellulosimicrobium arenosum]MBD8080743.1 ComEC/Rec2 family competence protein [Cellulosimicrobium arenosum]